MLSAILSPGIDARNECDRKGDLTSACGKLRPHVPSQLSEAPIRQEIRRSGLPADAASLGGA